MPFWRTTVELMLLRAGPQDMPGDRPTLAAVAVVYAMAGVVQVALLESFGRSAVLAVLTTILLGVYAGALLAFKELPNRFVQTAVALFATGAVFTVLMLGPDYAIAPYLKSLRQSASQPSAPSAQKTRSRPGHASQSDQKAKARTDSAANRGAPGQSSRGSGAPPVAPPALVFLLFIAAGVWRLVVYAHIFGQALDVSRWWGLTASVGFEVFLIVVFSLI